MVPQDHTVQEILEEVKSKLSDCSISISGELRLMEIYKSKIQKVFKLDEVVETGVSSVPDLRVEEIPEDQKQSEADDKGYKVIHVAHYCKDSSSIHYFGAPFYLKVGENETLASVKQRIQEKLDVKEEEFKKYKFAPVYGTQRYDYLNDEDVVAQCLAKVNAFRTAPALGLEHKDPNYKPTQKWYDKPIVIKN